MSYVPDNYDAYISQESEHERLERIYKRFELEMEGKENERVISSSETDSRNNRF